ncbi:hypothetical protein [Marinobacterium aestuariivivens]|uniref:Uncharacterized protein n=1 Tax=Marinobacterium aestuariivivens TaxID=1698799 RepID=A0ABW2AAK9_9GAMM
MRLIGALLLITCSLSPAQAADVSVVGNWSELIDSNDLTAGAGSDLRSPIESGSALATVDISATGGSSWAVKVSKSDINWPTGVSIAVRRTSDGTGAGTISGGTGYLIVTGTEQTLFSGSGDRSGIQLQLKTENLSIGDAPDTYGATLTYRVE